MIARDGREGWGALARFLKRGVLFVFALAGLTSAAAAAAAGEGYQPPANAPDVPFSAATGTRDPEARIRVPAGFRVTVFADHLGRTRHLAARADGTLYASLSQPVEGAGIVALKDTDGDGRADVVRRFGRVSGTGIAVHGDGLYFGENRRILRFALKAGEMLPTGAPQVVVDGFPEQGQHATKPMTFDDAGHMYVTVGAPSNACQQRMRTAGSPGLMPCPQRRLQAGIWRYDADRTGQRHGRDGKRFVTGIRNALGLDWNHAAGALFFATHGRDQLYSLWPQYYTPAESAELPGEEFHRAVEGDDYGWPYTYWDQLRGVRMKAPEYGGDGRMVENDPKYRSPLYAFPGHWAPMDLVFYEGRAFPAFFQHGAFIVFHGSWNRAPLPQEGYLVAFVPMDAAGRVSGRPIVFADGFKGHEPLASPRKAAFRPSGLAIGPDGALYVCEDKTGRIWKISRQENPAR
ncbi:MAG: sorbosone dehydrogenase [Alphaproteobacteria bacterium]|nr:MAG: sorbosone dehydrogenase [Alphaproteobacteria bacterium]